MPKIGDTRSTTQSLSNERTIIRRYKVTLMPDQATSYDPFTITLSYSPAEAATISPTSKAAVIEAFRRAIRVEHNNNHTPSNRQFFNGGIEFLGNVRPRPKR